MSTISLQLARSLAAQVNLTALGNCHRSTKDLAIDLIHQSGLSYATIAHGAFLHPTTVKNLAEETTRFPQHETVERILRYFGVFFQAKLVKVKGQYRPQPKS